MHRKSFDEPDETIPFDRGRLEVITIAGVNVVRATFEPGWSWRESIKPVLGTRSCEVQHLGYVISGRLGFRMDDGEEAIFGPGDAYAVPPRHDTWVEGDEPCVTLNFSWAESAKSLSLEEIRARMRDAAAEAAMR